MKKHLTFLWFSLCTSICNLQAQAPISVHRDHRYLQNHDGRPFFWLGDTAWELFHRMTRNDTKSFLELRRKQGFNVIQAVVLAEENGIREPNRYGDLPFIAEDPEKWAVTPGNNPKDANAYDYWDHVDFVVQLAAQKGMYIGMLPTWGDKVAHLWGVGPRIFDEEKARMYGKMLAQRYARHWNIIWILGGDRPAVYAGRQDNQPYDDRAIWRAMAEGIKEGEGNNRHFMTYHTAGGSNSTSQFIHTEPWLEMNSFQSGHGARETPAWDWVTRDLAIQPPKPTLDMEPCYEDHPVNPWDGKWTRQRGYFTAYDVRARIYRGVFAGSCGVTYGHHHIWQFLDTNYYKPINIGDTIIGWSKAMRAEGAYQMRHLKNLLLSRPYFSRIPDQALITSDKGSNYQDLVWATRDSLGSYAMIYLPQQKPVTVDLSKLSGDQKVAWWYNPRTGGTLSTAIENHQAASTFTPPPAGQDWVLVIDDAAKRFSKPGKRLL